MIHYIEMECSECNEFLAYVDLIPNQILVTGATYCQSCYEYKIEPSEGEE